MKRTVDWHRELAAELAAEQQQTVIRYSVTLAGDVAEAFERLHRDLGGEAVLSRGELTGRLLRRVLVDEPSGARRTKAAGNGSPPPAAASGP